MQIHPLRPATGWRWVRDAFVLLRRQPVALLAIVFLNLMLLSLSVVLPLVGSIAPLILTPGLMVGIMHAVRAADAGRMPSPALLFAGFRDDGGNAWRPLLTLGLLNALATLSALALAALADGGTLMRLATGQVQVDDDRRHQHGFRQPSSWPLGRPAQRRVRHLPPDAHGEGAARRRLCGGGVREG